MIPEFKVTLKDAGVIDIELNSDVPGELAVWVKEKLLSNFEGSPITPDTAKAMGTFVSCQVKALVERGSLYFDGERWRLKDRLVEWRKE